MFILILILVICAVPIFGAVLAFVNPDLCLELFSIRYHRLCSIRGLYLHGKNSTPKWSTEYFLRQARRMIDEQHAPIEIKEDLCHMLTVAEYYDYYFSLPNFDIYAYKSMFSDYKRGAYKTKIYSIEKQYKEILPKKIAENETALAMAVRAYHANWLDGKGQPNYSIIEKNQAAAIGRHICDKSGLSRADKLWGEFWKINESSFRKDLRYFHEDKKESESFLSKIEETLDSDSIN